MALAYTCIESTIIVISFILPFMGVHINKTNKLCCLKVF